MNILYLGGDTNALFYLLIQYCEKSGDTVTRFPLHNKSLKDVRDEVLLRSEDMLVFDYSAFEEEDQKEFVATLIGISEAKGNDTIIYSAMGEGTKLVNSLRGTGFTKILTTNDKKELRTSLAAALKAPKTKTSVSEMERIAQNREVFSDEYGSVRTEIIENITKAEGTIKIGIAGCLSRIGTTAVAIQFCKALNLRKSNFCGYIDVVGKYLANLKTHYYTDEIDNGISYGDVSLYRDVISLKMEGFDYLVYDYGIITEDNIMGLLDKDVVVIVGQAGPSEISAFTPIMSKTKASPVVNYAFYNAPKSKEDRDEILKSMGEYKDRTFFFEHVNDPFILDVNNKTAISNILNRTQSQEKSTKKGFFDRIFS